jgi:hypothetical protein
MRRIDGVLYCNDGDWVESLTALVEHADGRLALLDFSRPETLPFELSERPSMDAPEPAVQPVGV